MRAGRCPRRRAGDQPPLCRHREAARRVLPAFAAAAAWAACEASQMRKDTVLRTARERATGAAAGASAKLTWSRS